tara:strand:+ start:132 stop:422 length:291 start_codon:yes stop_codon:yes gene_type:complete
VGKKSNHLFYFIFSLALAQSTTGEESTDGLDFFINNCSECHQRNGRGIEGIYPALVGNGIDIAQMINYICHAWGNGENLKTNADVSTESISKLLQK